MSYIEAIILGLVQGISEFLPVSSTAHLIIVEKMFGLGFRGLVFELFLHFASVLAVIMYFFKDLLNLVKGFMKYLLRGKKEYRTEFKIVIFLLVSTCVTGVFGLFLEELLEGDLRGRELIAGGLVVSGILLCIVQKHKLEIKDNNKKKIEKIGFRDSIIIGLWQGLAIIPGISRSGATVVGGLWRNFDRSSALSYSFYLAIPVIISSTAIKFREIDIALLDVYTGQVMVSFVATFFFALLSIRFLIYLVKRSKLTLFSLYLFVLAALLLFL